MEQKVYNEAIAEYYQFFKGFIKKYYPDPDKEGAVQVVCQALKD